MEKEENKKKEEANIKSSIVEDIIMRHCTMYAPRFRLDLEITYEDEKIVVDVIQAVKLT